MLAFFNEITLAKNIHFCTMRLIELDNSPALLNKVLAMNNSTVVESYKYQPPAYVQPQEPDNVKLDVEMGFELSFGDTNYTRCLKKGENVFVIRSEVNGVTKQQVIDTKELDYENVMSALWALNGLGDDKNMLSFEEYMKARGEDIHQDVALAEYELQLCFA